MDSDDDKDDVAMELYDDLYLRLSAWGQHRVDREMRQRSIPELPWNQGLEPKTLPPQHEMERLARMNEQLILENQELFEENGELKQQLAELGGNE